MIIASRRQSFAASFVIAAVLAMVVAGVPGFAGSFATRADATAINFSVNSTAGAFVLKKGDPTYERTISNPAATLTGTVDNATGAITASTVFQPSYTANILGPFSLVIYIKADVIQVTPFTGTVDSSGAVELTSQQYLAISVYRTTTGTVGQTNGQNPATDQVLANGNTCRSLLNLDVKGTYDFAARSITLAEDPFAIPTFPADTRSTGGTAGCTSATASINTQVAGPTNTVTLTFGGSAVHAPDAPGLVVATPGNGQVTLDGVEPSDYGSPITSYTVTPYIAGVAQTPQVVPADAQPVITGLTNGTDYTFTAKATNANGTSPESKPSAVVTVGAPLPPGFVSATPTAGGATVVWWPPFDNGNDILGYYVTPYIGGVAQTPQPFGGQVASADLTGLTPGTAYTFTVTAYNGFYGGSPESAHSNAVTPT